MSNVKVPNSPPLPTQEVADVPKTQIPAQLTAELDLNSDSDNDVEMSCVSPVKPFENFEQFEHPDSLPSTPDTLANRNVLMSSIPKDTNYVTPMMDFSDPIKAPADVINPFGANKTLSSSSPIPIRLEDMNLPILSDSQEQKLIEYIEERLMAIQRGFVKYLSSKKEAIKEGLTWIELVTKLDEMVEFLWYSIFHLKDVPAIYHGNILIDSSFKVIFSEKFLDMKDDLNSINKYPTKILMQNEVLTLPMNVQSSTFVSFLIKILGDIVDYVEKYNHATFEEWIVLLRLIAKLDNALSIIIDYSNQSSKLLINTTEKVRIASIIQRTKIITVSKFDQFTGKLDTDQIAHHRSAIEAFQIFVGELYEGIVDRTSA
ncbi:hypothetical protein CANINC_000765 [Pichia inconspicua]|uniref:Uncharacterized protein n=1 Tax=Pichia inconspicua TaxID=52247 RepID=A0A4V4NG49_9ASCO|nr:hypothetical protein CANINC_000765 [[Candida] inconspicua]